MVSRRPNDALSRRLHAPADRRRAHRNGPHVGPQCRGSLSVTCYSIGVDLLEVVPDVTVSVCIYNFIWTYLHHDDRHHHDG